MDNRARAGDRPRSVDCGHLRMELVDAPGKTMDEVIGRPGTRKLHMAFPHNRAVGGKLTLIAIHTLAVNEVGDVEHHLSTVGQAATYLLVERREEAMHLEAHGPGPGLALALARGVFAQAGEILASHSLNRKMLVDGVSATVIYIDLEMHLSLAAKLVNVREKLTLVRADGFAEAFVVIEDGAKAERQHSGMLEAVGDDSSMVNSGLLIEGFGGVVFAYDDGEVAGGIKEDLITTNSVQRFQCDGFTMTSHFRK